MAPTTNAWIPDSARRALSSFHRVFLGMGEAAASDSNRPPLLTPSYTAVPRCRASRDGFRPGSKGLRFFIERVRTQRFVGEQRNRRISAAGPRK